MWRRSRETAAPSKAARNLGWAGARAGCAVYGGTRGHTEEPSDSHVLPAFVSGRKSKEVSVDGLAAETAHHLKCHGEEPDVVASGDGSRVCGRIGELGLDGDVVSTPNRCEEFLRVTLKIPSSALDSKDSC